jgi:hydrogenase maturation protease
VNGRGPRTEPTRTLIAGVGHRFWRDNSAGPEWCDRLARLQWPEGVTVEDYGFGALSMVHWLEDGDFDRAVFVCSEQRGRPPASLHVYRYCHDPGSITLQRVHEHLFEAVAGVIAIDLLLVAAGHFQALPDETWVIELEPVNTSWGEGISHELEALYPEVEAQVRKLVVGEQPAAEGSKGAAVSG